jgi:Cys-rich repeat protein
MPLGQVIGCSYDECTTDDACPANNLCQCGTATGEGRTANTCVPSNCRVDSDCGAGGSCSPSYGTTCGALFGVVGYFCHKAADECTKDECVNDSDCTSTEAGPAGSGYCAWDPTSSAWSCFYGVCAG